MQEQAGGRKKIATAALSTALAVLSTFSIAGYFGGKLVLDLLSQFRLVYVIVWLVLLPFIFLSRSKFIIALGIACGVITLFPVLYLFLPNGSPPLDRVAEEFSILEYNTEFQHNIDFDAFRQLVSQTNPDVIVLVEVDHMWQYGLQPLSRDYRYNRFVLQQPGMAVYSKIPMVVNEVRYFGATHHPRIVATLTVGERQVHLVVAHPTTPKSEKSFAERNDELSTIAEEFREIAAPKVLAADLNCGPWSTAFAQFLQSSALRDSERGYGPQPSWPARNGRVFPNIPIPPLIPIDHILTSKDLFVLERKAGPAIGSDHLPVFVRMRFDDTPAGE